MDGHDAVQRVIGVEILHRGLARTVAPHILIGHVAAHVVLIDVLLLLHVLFGGVNVGHPQQLADGVIFILLHPAVGVLHPGHAAHAIVLVGGGAAVGLHHGGQVAHVVVGVGDHAVIRVGDGGLIAVAVVELPGAVSNSTRGFSESRQKNRPLVLKHKLNQIYHQIHFSEANRKGLE